VDTAGSFVSGACAIHCLISALLVGASGIGALGPLFSSTTETIFLVLAVGSAVLAGMSGFRSHRSWRLVAIMSVGLLLLTTARVLHGFPSVPHVIAPLISILGAVCLVAFHIQNRRLLAAHRASDDAFQADARP
jgi:hypothetical protein